MPSTGSRRGEPASIFERVLGVDSQLVIRVSPLMGYQIPTRFSGHLRSASERVPGFAGSYFPRIPRGMRPYARLGLIPENMMEDLEWAVDAQVTQWQATETPSLHLEP